MAVLVRRRQLQTLGDVAQLGFGLRSLIAQALRGERRLRDGLARSTQSALDLGLLARARAQLAGDLLANRAVLFELRVEAPDHARGDRRVEARQRVAQPPRDRRQPQIGLELGAQALDPMGPFGERCRRELGSATLLLGIRAGQRVGERALKRLARQELRCGERLLEQPRARVAVALSQRALDARGDRSADPSPERFPGRPTVAPGVRILLARRARQILLGDGSPLGRPGRRRERFDELRLLALDPARERLRAGARLLRAQTDAIARRARAVGAPRQLVATLGALGQGAFGRCAPAHDRLQLGLDVLAPLARGVGARLGRLAARRCGRAATRDRASSVLPASGVRAARAAPPPRPGA